MSTDQTKPLLDSDNNADLVPRSSKVTTEINDGLKTDQFYADFNATKINDGKTIIGRLTVVDGVAILVGIIIGSGVFSSPGLALDRCGSPGSVLIAWATSGLLVMLASFCYLELASMMPSAGGDFDYLKRAYGERVAFAFAWYNFFVGKTGSQAIIATIFGRYFEAVVTGNVHSLENDAADENIVGKACAVVLIVLVTILNCLGAKESAWLSSTLTITKVLLVLSVFVFAVIYVAYSPNNAHVIETNLSFEKSFRGSNGLFGFGAAMVACLWSFDGWADGNFLQEELINPIRDLPRIVGIGVSVVTLCYILINVGYLSVLSTEDIIDANAIAVQFGSTVSSSMVPRGSARLVLPIILALGVSLSTAGSVNGSVMTGSRAHYAVARDGMAPAMMAKLNRWGAPWMALIVQGVWTIILLLLPGSNFASLLDYFGPTSWLFYALSSSALIKLRYSEPDTHRPFRVPLFPLPPIIVCLIAGFILVSSLLTSPLFVLLALVFVLLSFPVHLAMEYYAYRSKGYGNLETNSETQKESENTDAFLESDP